jgi:hypothetical protein
MNEANAGQADDQGGQEQRGQDCRGNNHWNAFRATLAQKISRRLFVQYSAAVVGSSSLVASVVLKTDAIGQTIGSFSVGDDHSPYTYVS